MPPPESVREQRRRDRRRADLVNTQEIQLRQAPSVPPAETDVEPIAPFGRFELLGRIATGGMAEILLARESIEGAGSRHVVIKAVRGEYAEDGDFAKMFMNEGRLAMRLTHPNICTVYECGRHAGRFFIAMEYVHGQTLRDVLVRSGEREHPLPIPVLLRVFALVAEALDSAHGARDPQGRRLSIVHRDVSPQNIMIRYDGVVKLLDFGVAKAEHSQHSTESGALKGKFSYMSPEQALGTPIDARADIFSLGVCMFEAITGRRLFQRKAQYDTLKAILEAEPPPLSAFRDDIPDELETILQRALRRDREARYQSAAELQQDLEALLTEIREVASTRRIGQLMEELFPESAGRAPPLERDQDLRDRYAVESAVPPVEAAPLPPTTRSRLPLAAGAAVVLALAVLGGWIAFGSNDSVPRDAAVPRPAGSVVSLQGHEHAASPIRETPEVAPAEVAPVVVAPVVVAPADVAPVEIAPVVAAPAVQPAEDPPSDGTLREVQASRPARTTTSSEEPSRTSSRTPRTEGAAPASRRRGPVIVTDPGF